MAHADRCDRGLAVDLFCTNCGNQRTIAQRFCGSCGAAFGAAPAAPVETSAAAHTSGYAASDQTVARAILPPHDTPLGGQSVSALSVPPIGGGFSGLVAQLVARSSAQRDAIAAASTTAFSVLVAVIADVSYATGLARGLPLVVVAVVSVAAVPMVLPGTRVEPRTVTAVTAAAFVLVVVLHQVVDQWGVGRLVVCAVSGLAYGAVASTAQWTSRRSSPLTVVAVVGGAAVGILGAVVLNAVYLYDKGFWRINLYTVLSAAFVCAVPVGCAVLAWATPLRQMTPSSAVGPGVDYVAHAPSGSNGLAVGALVCGLLGVSVPAIVLGHIALSQIKSSGGRQGGRGMAIAGLVLGYVALAIVVLVFVLLGIFAASIDSGGF